MDINKKDDNGWVLCPSKSQPGKFYYFNLVNGEAVWSFPDAKKPINKTIQNVADKSQSFPEPASLKDNDNFETYPNNSINFTTKKKQVQMPTFGQSSFPRYIFNENPSTSKNPYVSPNVCMTNKNINMPIFAQTTPMVVCAALPLMVLEQNETQTLDQVTQTCELDEVLVHSCETPLCKRIINYENPVITFTKDNKLKNNISTSTPLKPKPTIDPIIPTIDLRIKEPLIKDAVLDMKNQKSNEPKKILQNKVEKNQQNIFQSDEKAFADLNLEAKEKHLESKEDDVDLVKLDRNDLRLLLMARKRRNTEGENSTCSSGMKTIKLNHTDDHAEAPPPKKRVTFATNSPKITDNENLEKCSNDGNLINTLKDLAESNIRQDCWYIVVDADVLLENYAFINDFVLSDVTCRLLIPEGVRRDINSLCSGDSAGRTHVYTARHIVRTLHDPPKHVAVISDIHHDTSPIRFYNDTNMVTNDDILNCCLETINRKYHVVLLTNNEDLRMKATSLNIHAYEFDAIKDSLHKTNDNCELNTKKSTNNLFLSTKFQSSRTHKMFQNIPGLMEGKSINIQTNKKSIFDDETVTTLRTNEKEMNLKNDFTLQTNKTFLFQNCNTPLFENRTVESNKEFDILEKNKTQSISQLDQQPVLQRANGNMKTADVPNSNINDNIAKDNDTNKNMTEISVENNLKKFFIRHKVMENRIKERAEEWICIFIQIMEDGLCYVLQNASFKTDLILPWTLQEMIERITLLYEDHTTLKIIVRKLLCSMSECMSDKGKIKPDIKPHDFIRTFGCGMLLIQCLKNLQPECEELVNAKKSLTKLLQTLEDETEIDFDDSTTKVGYNLADTEKRRNHVKQPSEIIKYLKRHYEEWGSYDELPEQDQKQYAETSNNEDPKIIRITGKDLDMLKIDNNKAMTIIKCANDSKSDGILAGPKPIENKVKLESNNKIINISRINSSDVKQKIPINLMTNNDNKITMDELNFTVNDNTFDTIKTGVKVKRRVVVLKEYEDKLKMNAPLDKDLLDYSDDIGDNRNNTENSNFQVTDILKMNKSDLNKQTNDSANDDSEKIYSGYNNSQKTNCVIESSNGDSRKTKLEDSDTRVNISDYMKTKSDINDSGLNKSDCISVCHDIIPINTVNKNTRTLISYTRVEKNDNEIEKGYISVSDSTSTKEDSKKTGAEINVAKRNKSDSVIENDYISVSDDTNDSGIGIETQMTYSLVKTFLSELSSTFRTVHTFIDKNLDEFRNEEIADDKKTRLHEKVNKVRLRIGDIIDKLKRIIERESNERVALNTLLVKIDEAANDKRIKRYRSVVRKCLEQAQNLQNALKIMLSITDTEWDGSLSIHTESISSSIRYLNIFE